MIDSNMLNVASFASLLRIAVIARDRNVIARDLKNNQQASMQVLKAAKLTLTRVGLFLSENDPQRLLMHGGHSKLICRDEVPCWW